MAQLKDTLITGGLRVTDTIITNVLLATAIRALTSLNSSTYDLGNNGLVLKSTGSGVYWADDSVLSLDKTDTAVSGQYVSAVSLSDGIITVTRANFSPSLTLTAGNSSTAPKIKVTVNTKVSDDITLTTASTDAYGVTKLANTIDTTPLTNVAATPRLVADAVSAGLAANDAMVFKGTLGTGGTIASVPTQAYTDADGKHYSKGWTYKIITDGVYAGEYCEAGDLLIAITDSNGTGTSSVDEHWVKVLTNVDGPIYLGRKTTNNTFNDVTTNALLKFTGTGRATASSGIISDETNKRLSLFDIFAYLRVVFNMGKGPIEAGWRRVCTISNLSVHPQFFITIGGGYNQVAPMGAIIAVSARTTNRQMSLLSCSGLYASEKLKKVRLINIGNSSCYFDIYCDAHTDTGTWGNIIFNFIGNITISEIQTATTINTDTGGVELTFRNIKDLPIFTLQDNDGTNSTTSTFTHYDLTLTLPATIKATLTGNADSATTASKLSNTTKIGDTNKPVYFTASGIPTAINYTINASISSATAKSLAVYTSATAIGETAGKIHVNSATLNENNKVYEELVIGDLNNYFGRVALYGPGKVAGGNYIVGSKATSGWITQKLPATAGWLAVGGNGSDTGVGSDTLTMYLSTTGVLTVGQLVHTLSGGGTAIAGSTDLNTITAFGNYYLSLPATAKTVLNNPFNDTDSLEAFTMKVFSGNGNGNSNYLIQELKTYRYGYYFTRSSTNAGTDWTTWKAYAFNPKTGNNNNDCDVGSLTLPVYVKKTGEIAATTCTLEANVPPTAVFTDEKVKLTLTSENAEYKILVSNNASPANGGTDYTQYSSNVTMNPSTNTITADTYKVTSNATITYNSTNGCLEIIV